MPMSLESDRSKQNLEFVIELLGLSDCDVLRAVLSCYVPCQPGALVGSWKQRKNYGHPPTSRQLWEIMVKHDFRCCKCGSQYKMAFDHKDDDASNNDPYNLQVLCKGCNRSKNQIVLNKDSSMAIINALRTFYEDGLCPEKTELFNCIKPISSGGSSGSTASFLLHRLRQLLEEPE